MAMIPGTQQQHQQNIVVKKDDDDAATVELSTTRSYSADDDDDDDLEPVDGIVDLEGQQTVDYLASAKKEEESCHKTKHKILAFVGVSILFLVILLIVLASSGVLFDCLKDDQDGGDDTIHLSNGYDEQEGSAAATNDEGVTVDYDDMSGNDFGMGPPTGFNGQWWSSSFSWQKVRPESNNNP